MAEHGNPIVFVCRPGRRLGLSADDLDAIAEFQRLLRGRARPANPVFPHHDGPGHPQYLSSLTPGRAELTGLDARRPGLVARPQDCDCGASQVAMVAHYERCAARLK